MKSFTKKLAFIMVFAMVIALAAPTAKTAFAEGELRIAYQEGGAVTAIILMKGEEVDLRYLGAAKEQAGWKKVWTSSNEKIAVVDKKGVVKAVNNGTCDVTFTLGEGAAAVTGTVKVYVGCAAVAQALTLGTAENKTMSRDGGLVLAADDKEGVDLNFYGFPNWENEKSKFEFEWETSKEYVVTVDQKGVVVPTVKDETVDYDTLVMTGMDPARRKMGYGAIPGDTATVILWVRYKGDPMVAAAPAPIEVTIR